MEEQKILFDFSGRTVDRSVFDFNFDGADLKILIQNTTIQGAFTEINFEWVVQFYFESKEAISILPSYQGEALVELDASDYVRERRHRIGSYFTKDVRRFALYLLDVGNLHVISRTVSVSEPQYT